MTETTFDPKAIFESYRNAFAPALKAQQEAVAVARKLEAEGKIILKQESGDEYIV